jgi:antitoxin (DNA-binding transcriptional repressor) of toxin-antitoxin stability system
MIRVTSREFRDKQAGLFDLADNGEEIIIKKGERAYTLVPVDDNDLYLSPEAEKRI